MKFLSNNRVDQSRAHLSKHNVGLAKDAELNPLTKQFSYSTLLRQHMVGDVVVTEPKARQL